MIMRFLRKSCLMPIFLITIFSFAEDLNYSRFSSYEELIVYESEKILNLAFSDCEELANAYMDRAESYIINSNYLLALEDLQKGYHLAEFCRPQARPLILTRPLFDLAFSYALMGNMEELQLVGCQLGKVFDTFDCTKTEKKQ